MIWVNLSYETAKKIPRDKIYRYEDGINNAIQTLYYASPTINDNGGRSCFISNAAMMGK